jgi:putative transposase
LNIERVVKLLEDTKVEKLISKFDLIPQAIKEISFIRNSEPSRRVRSGIKNVSGLYPSKKMGVTIQFESRTVELAAIIEKEHDINVFEYFDQPPSIPIQYQVDGKKRGHRYTADFFVISENWVGWEEWKTEEDLIKLSQKYPHRYSLDEDGNWVSPPVEEYAKTQGLSFRIRSSKEINWNFQRNIRFLEDYLLNESPSIPLHDESLIKDIVANSPGITLKTLLEHPDNVSSDYVYTLISLKEIYLDLYKHSLNDLDLVQIYINEEVAQTYNSILNNRDGKKHSPRLIQLKIGRKLNWDEKKWTIINIGEHKISLLNDYSEVVEIPKDTFNKFISNETITGIEAIESEGNQIALELIKTADEDELRQVNNKVQVVNEILNGRCMNEFSISERTLRDWVKKYRDAEALYGIGLIGLITKNRNKGNRERKLPKETIELMEKYINDEYQTITQKTRTTVYGLFCKECDEKGIPKPSLTTFCENIKKKSKYEQTKNRKGRKAAYKYEPTYWHLEITTPRHGERPFEIAHMDHTQLDLEIICSTTRKNLGRPWITFMMDAYSRRILAYYLTFDEPSYRSNMMTLRMCVKRYGRLPYSLVVDGGKDFQSTYFDTFLAAYRIQKLVRPGSKPRYGSVCERLFGTTNKMFIHNLTGNTQVMTNVRQVSKEVNPKNHAIWTLPKLTEMFSEWVYEIYDTLEHSTLGESPRQIYTENIYRTGKREFTFIAYDELFLMLSLPTTIKGSAKVQPGNGVKINRFYYWSDVFYNSDVEGKQLAIRYDPFNMGIAYAYIKNKWVQLKSQYYYELVNRTEKEIQLACEEMRRRQKLQGKESSISVKKLIDFLKNAQDSEKIEFQRMKDQELRKSLNVLDGGKDVVKTKATRKGVTESSSQSFERTTGLNQLKEQTKNKRIIYGGILKDWIFTTLRLNLQNEKKEITMDDFYKTALSISQCVSIAGEITNGEEDQKENENQREILLSKIGLKPSLPINVEEKETPVKKRRVGERKPKRDTVGVDKYA